MLYGLVSDNINIILNAIGIQKFPNKKHPASRNRFIYISIIRPYRIQSASIHPF
jgi:hypothetical protein